MLVVGGVSPMESEGFYGKIELKCHAKSAELSSSASKDRRHERHGEHLTIRTKR